MATNSFVQVPPDSTGKKIYHQQHTVDGAPVQAPVVHVGCAKHPDHIQLVDARGQAFTRFADGSPTMDAFGNLRVSNAQMIGAYEYTNGDMTDLFSDFTATNGSITYVQAKSETHIAVTDEAGSEARRVTNRYHYYQPGVGNLVIITLALNDNGKANNIRGWAYGDLENGLIFRVNGTTLEAGIRSNTSGTVTNTFIPRENWNGDKLDGTGYSGMTLDLTKANFYWIDFAWLGVGSVRFGVLAPDGQRVVCHTFENPNSNLGAYMQSGSLPISFHNYNTGPTSGPSVIKSICVGVYSESQTDYTFWRFSDIERDPVAVTTNTHILSMRPKYQIGGRINRVGIYPDALSVYVSGGSVKLSIVDDADLSAPTWSIDSAGTAQGDISTSTVSNGSKFKTWYLEPGCHDLCLSCLYETNDEGYHVLGIANSADDTYKFTIVATKLDGTTVNVGACLSYRELR